MEDIGSLSVFSYIGPFWFVGLVSEHKNDSFLRYHINQGLVLFIAEMILGVAVWLLTKLCEMIPLVGQIVSALLCAAYAVLCIVLSVKGALNAAKGLTKPLPVIGSVTLIGGGRVRR